MNNPTSDTGHYTTDTFSREAHTDSMEAVHLHAQLNSEQMPY